MNSVGKRVKSGLFSEFLCFVSKSGEKPGVFQGSWLDQLIPYQIRLKQIRYKNQERTSIAQGIVYKVTLFELHELACICLKEILHISHISRYRS